MRSNKKQFLNTYDRCSHLVCVFKTLCPLYIMIQIKSSFFFKLSWGAFWEERNIYESTVVCDILTLIQNLYIHNHFLKQQVFFIYIIADISTLHISCIDFLRSSAFSSSFDSFNSLRETRGSLKWLLLGRHFMICSYGFQSQKMFWSDFAFIVCAEKNGFNEIFDWLKWCP